MEGANRVGLPRGITHFLDPKGIARTDGERAFLAFLKPLCLDASPRRTHWLDLDASFTLVESLLG
jgi:hypothetical protein